MAKFKRLVSAALFTLWLVAPLQLLPQESFRLPQAQIEKIETFVRHQMTQGKIPGMSVVIVMGDQTVYKKGFGFADTGKKEPVTPDTLFELGSNSKAFTGLGILKLEKDGLLKLNDPVETVIPWLKLEYRGEEVPVTVGQFLYQNCGVPFESIGGIPETESEEALEITVRTLLGRPLVHAPGTAFKYATINYDVLGLIIKKLSGESFESYMQTKVLQPLQLNNTYLFRKDARAKGMAVGYKLCFGEPAAYNAPTYRGNTPAGYFITNGEDLARWLKIQMGTVEVTGFDKELIDKSHISDPGLPNSNYAAGWMIFKNSGQVLHGGNNPNFSSFIGFSPESKIGVGVLANRNTNFTTGTARGIGTVLQGMEPAPSRAGRDMNMKFDSVSTKVALSLLPFLFLAIILILRSVIKIAVKKKRFNRGGIKGAVAFIASSVLLAAWVYVISLLPSFLGYNLPLSFGFVWMPMTFSYAVYALFLLGFLYYLFFLSAFFFRKTGGGRTPEKG